MNPNNPQPAREEIEVRLTALLLGELPPAEAELLRWTISQDPELAKVRDRLKSTIGLVRETGSSPEAAAAGSSVPLKMSEERRQKLLAHFKTITPKEFEPEPAARWKFGWMVQLAAVLVVVGLLAVMLLPMLSAAKHEAKMNTLGAYDLERLQDAQSLSLPQSLKHDKGIARAQAAAPLVVVTPETNFLAFDASASQLPPLSTTPILLPPPPATAADGSSSVVYSAPVQPPANGLFSSSGYVVASSGGGGGGGAGGNSTFFGGAGGTVALPPATFSQGININGSTSDTFATANPNSSQPAVANGGGYSFSTSGAAPPSAGIPQNVESDRDVDPATGLPRTAPSAGESGLADAKKAGEIGADQNITRNPRQAIVLPAGSTTYAGRLDRAATGELDEGGHQDLGIAGIGGATESTFTPANGELAGNSQNSDKNGGDLPTANRQDSTKLYYRELAPSTPASTLHSREASRAAVNPPASLLADNETRMQQVEKIWVLPVASTGSFVAGVIDGPVVQQAVQTSTITFVTNSATGNFDYYKNGALAGSVPANSLQSFAKGNLPTASAPREQEPPTDINMMRAPELAKVAPIQSMPAPVPSSAANPQGAFPSNAPEPAMPAAQPPAPPVADDLPPVAPSAAVAPVLQPEIATKDNAFSTFSLNVSDVSFKLAAASLDHNIYPQPGTIRSEEFINAFDYRDPEPPAGAPVGFTWDHAGDPFEHNRDFLRFSIKTAAEGRVPGRPLNLVLLLDKSGSMERADRVAIMREALRVLATQLGPHDTLSVITFASTARLQADGVPGDQAGNVFGKLSGITPEGGTNLEDAMNLAYQTALRHFLAGGINRVVLMTDGAANLGDVNAQHFKNKVESNRIRGVALDCFGIGWEDYNDNLLELLASHGDGRYGFLNTPEEASSGFATQLAGALKVAAADVKVQVEFNPARVTAYRQIGYASYQLTKQQFRDNTVDAAVIGAAESGNALYTVQINPQGDGPVATVRVRFRVPGTSDVQEHSWLVPYTGTAVALDQASPSMRLAATAATFAEWLMASPATEDLDLDQLLNYLKGVPAVYGTDPRPKQLELMIHQAKNFAGKG